MIVRIVRMTFRKNEIDTFLALFERHRESIRSFPGCLYLELHRDADQSNIFCTYSHWESSEALDGYRNSALFKEVWPATKILFSDRPVAFTNTIEMVV